MLQPASKCAYPLTLTSGWRLFIDNLIFHLNSFMNRNPFLIPMHMIYQIIYGEQFVEGEQGVKGEPMLVVI